MDIKELEQRLLILEGLVKKLEIPNQVYGPILTPVYEPAPYWQNPNWIPPKIT